MLIEPEGSGKCSGLTNASKGNGETLLPGRRGVRFFDGSLYVPEGIFVTASSKRRRTRLRSFRFESCAGRSETL